MSGKDFRFARANSLTLIDDVSLCLMNDYDLLSVRLSLGPARSKSGYVRTTRNVILYAVSLL